MSDFDGLCRLCGNEGADEAPVVARSYCAECRAKADAMLLDEDARDEASASERADADEIRCQCGETGGDRCEWVGPRFETVRVRWVDRSMRGTEEAAGTWRGVSSTIRVTRECAELIVADEGEWAEILDEVTT